jgi:beta-aspartyl-peptidase (threonine type)
MDGRDRAGGAVAGITVAKNPISVARLVMNKTTHVLLAGAGADQFARQAGAEIVTPDYFWTERTRQRWEAPKQSRLPSIRDDHYGTVGCVALDQAGNLAAGTSTGGLTNKHVGRVGDSPIIGAGTYADNNTCAVSCTGVGELFIRHAIAHDISARMEYTGQSLDAAVGYSIDERLEPGTGGIIAIDRQGKASLRYNTRAMPRGLIDSSGRFEVAVLGSD